MIRGTKSFIHSSSKKSTRNSDADKLDPIHMNLIRQGFAVIREPVIECELFSTRNKIRNPDLKISFGKDFVVFLELDGKVHGTLDQPTERTISRNADYLRANKRFIVLSEEDAKHYNLDFSDLAAYRVTEEYSKYLAEKEALAA